MELSYRRQALLDRCRRGDLGGVEHIPDVGKRQRIASPGGLRVRLALRQPTSFSLRLGRHGSLVSLTRGPAVDRSVSGEALALAVSVPFEKPHHGACECGEVSVTVLMCSPLLARGSYRERGC